jgi:hypothetical protein
MLERYAADAMATSGLGIDVAADRLYAVQLAPDGSVVRAAVLGADELAEVRAWAAEVDAVAIDAPEAPSTEPHTGDSSLSTKFRPARCAEIGLGQRRSIWVPWVTPASEPFSGWMSLGFELFAALQGVATVVETYPYAIFRTLNQGRAVSAKTTLAGHRARCELLRANGVVDPPLAMWGHDGLDATAAALVALGVASSRSEPVTCGHDGSAIWLPVVEDAMAGAGGLGPAGRFGRTG